MSLAKNILLFGATGTIGSFILDAILPVRAQFNRVAIFTSPHTAETKSAHLEKLKQQNVEVIIGSVEDEEAIKAAYEGLNLPLSPIYQSQYINPNPNPTSNDIDTNNPQESIP
jgi:FlaA1/EpsC-like NDP-sugar epimerase